MALTLIPSDLIEQAAREEKWTDSDRRHCSRILRQAFEQASHYGDIVHGVEAGRISRSDVTVLGAVLAGAAEGRRHAEEATVFDSTGLAIQDLAVALAAMEWVDELDLPTFPVG
jgi:ornithine cyclodeaminase/alanine dehydrogenase-like protein (mu-crystallin family)